MFFFLYPSKSKIVKDYRHDASFSTAKFFSSNAFGVVHLLRSLFRGEGGSEIL